MARKRTVIGIAVLIGAAIAVPATAALAYGRETTPPASPRLAPPSAPPVIVSDPADAKVKPPRPKVTSQATVLTRPAPEDGTAPPPGPLPLDHVAHGPATAAPRVHKSAAPSRTPGEELQPPTDPPTVDVDPADK